MSNVDQARLDLMNKYWNAANYLTIGQIYLKDNPLLKEPLLPQHIKPRLLGHWGTSPGLSFIYVHLNRLIQDHNLDMIYMAGPGHAGVCRLPVRWRSEARRASPARSCNARRSARLLRRRNDPQTQTRIAPQP